MPEVDGNDPAVQASAHINLVPCSTPDENDPNIAHLYNARQFEHSKRVADLGWLTLEAARLAFADQAYAVRWGSHTLCPTCFEATFDTDS